jgi:hypothetical protein
VAFKATNLQREVVAVDTIHHLLCLQWSTGLSRELAARALRLGIIPVD